jgi:hypothetical protein
MMRQRCPFFVVLFQPVTKRNWYSVNSVSFGHYVQGILNPSNIFLIHAFSVASDHTGTQFWQGIFVFAGQHSGVPVSISAPFVYKFAECVF